MRVAIMQQSGSLSETFKKSAGTLYQATGNTGNQAFRYAVSHQIEHSGEYISWSDPIEEIREKYDVIVFAAANLINPSIDSGARAAFFEKLGLPLVVVGLGAQAKQEADQIELSDGTKRFLHVIRDLTDTISVRGPFSAEVLAKEGVHNVVVTGCPSNFINLDPDLGGKIKKKIRQCENVRHIVINVTVSPTRRKLSTIHRKMNQSFFSWTLGRKSTYVVQSPESLVKYVRHQGHKKAINDTLLKSIQYSLTSGVSQDYILREILPSFVSMFDIPTWMEFMQSVDLSVGTRLHGNMIALQSGVPTIFFPFDTRTRETVSVMKLPYVENQHLEKGASVEEIVNLVRFNPTDYQNNRQVLASRFADIYEGAGISLQKDFKNFIESPSQ